MSMTAQPKTGTPRPKLVPWLHAPVSGTPYFDEARAVAQNNVHTVVLGETVAFVKTGSEEAVLRYLSDEPRWYPHLEIDPTREASEG